VHVGPVATAFGTAPVLVSYSIVMMNSNGGASGPMGVKSISNHHNAAGIRTRDGGRRGIGAVHKVLTRTDFTSATTASRSLASGGS
jgi:hypothetical protein